MAGAIYFFYLSAKKFIGAYARPRKTWAKTPLPRQARIMVILRKRVFKQEVRGAEGKSEIAAIPNKYKDTLDDLIDSLDTESLEAPRSKRAPISARPDLEGDHLNKDARGQRGEESRWEGKKRGLVREDSSP